MTPEEEVEETLVPYYHNMYPNGRATCGMKVPFAMRVELPWCPKCFTILFPNEPYTSD